MTGRAGTTSETDVVRVRSSVSDIAETFCSMASDTSACFFHSMAAGLRCWHTNLFFCRKRLVCSSLVHCSCCKYHFVVASLVLDNVRSEIAFFTFNLTCQLRVGKIENVTNTINEWLILSKKIELAVKDVIICTKLQTRYLLLTSFYAFVRNFKTQTTSTQCARTYYKISVFVTIFSMST